MSPRFSIIIPTRNRAESLDRCLAAIEQLDYQASRFEVIVIDDGSTAPILNTLNPYKDTLTIFGLRTHGAGPAFARNLALRHATGDVVVFTDDDCRPHPGWLTAFEHAVLEHPGAGLGGRILDAPENGIYGRASQMIVSFLYEYAEHSTGMKFFCSNNLAFPRQALLDLGGFDESFPLAAAEDRDLCERWLRQGGLAYVPRAVVDHHQDLQLYSYIRQHYRYGVGAFQFWARRTRERVSSHRIEGWGFYAGMMAYPLREESYARAVLSSALIMLSQAALAVGYYSTWLRFQATTRRSRDKP